MLPENREEARFEKDFASLADDAGFAAVLAGRDVGENRLAG